MTDRYHHGDLKNALRSAAVEVIAENGLGHFSLREVARRAGVSHTAPAHHFGDVRGLLTSLATEGFDTLYSVTSAAVAAETEPAERLSAMGEAYVSLATEYPAHCQVMFRTDVIDIDDECLGEAGMRAYGVLHDVVRELVEAEGLDSRRRRRRRVVLGHDAGARRPRTEARTDRRPRGSCSADDT